MVKEFLRANGVPYVLKDVRRDPEALAEFRRLGFLLPPVTVVNGVAVCGFDPERLLDLLGADERPAGPDRPEDAEAAPS